MQSLVATLRNSRQLEYHVQIGPQRSSPPSSFDPDNLAMARAKENFEKAQNVVRRDNPQALPDATISGARLGHIASSPHSHYDEKKSSGIMEHSALRESDLAPGNPLNISSDSSLDDVLEEAERWVGMM